MRFKYFFCAIAGVILLLGCQSPSDRINKLILQLNNSDSSIQSKTVEDLVTIGSPAVEPLIIALKDNNASMRWGAARALGQIKDTRAIEPLISSLKDTDLTVRETAAGALVNIGEPAVDPLITALKINDSQIKRTAIQVLEKINDARAEGPLIAALQDNDMEIRKTATIAIGTAKIIKAIPSLILLFKDTNEEVRKAAANALTGIGAPAVEPLTAVLNDSETYLIMDNGKKLEIRQEAAATLGKIKDTRTIKPLVAALADKDSEYRKDVSDALVAIGTPAVEPLISALNDNDIQVRREASRILGNIKDPRAIEPLIAMIKNNDIFAGHEAFLGLTDMGNVASPKFEPFLLNALKGGDLKTIAACYDYYIRRGEPGSEPVLINALNRYADAYGNYDQGMAMCFLNCGNSQLKQATVMWGTNNAFQICSVTCGDTSPAFGRSSIIDTTGQYCGKSYITWGNKAFNSREIYVLCRPIKDSGL
jgi:HEAT repeat protein